MKASSRVAEMLHRRFLRQKAASAARRREQRVTIPLRFNGCWAEVERPDDMTKLRQASDLAEAMDIPFTRALEIIEEES